MVSSTGGGSGKSRSSKRDKDDNYGGKSPSNSKSEKKKKSKRAKGETYTTYIYKMLKTVHPQIGMATKAMMIMNSFMTDAFERIALEAGKLCTYNQKETLTDREIKSAVRLGLPGELASHAIEDGMRAVARYQKNSKDGH